MRNKKKGRVCRARRMRWKIASFLDRRVRLSVFRSSRYIYAQIIDDAKGVTLVSASSLEKSFRSENGTKNGSNILMAEKVGCTLAHRALEAGVKKVVFDRSGYVYHGRIRALANAARENGLEF